MIKSAPLTFVEMPGGIFTSDGIWYHTTVRDLESYSPDIIKKLGLQTLFQKAGDWSRLPVTLTVWALPCLLLILSPIPAVLVSFFLFLVMSFLAPNVVVYGLVGPIRFMNHPIVQGLLFVMAMSYFASSGQMAAVGSGVIGFVLLRWQILTVLVDLVSKRARPTQIPIHDRILKNVLVSASRKYGAPLFELDRMEKRMIEIMTYHKNRK
ncbi:MAG: hypothetical protein O3B41_00500 [Bacteroidetes bacterium]|nr:hypothetical protein [Bacteroidota bacterium]